MDNKTLQQEELEVLESIYGKQWKKEIDGENSYSIDINADVKLYILLNCEYPLNNPPGYQLFAPTLSKQQKNEISLALDAIFLENLREPVLYQWIEKVKELVADISQPDDIDQDRTDMISISANNFNATGKTTQNDELVTHNIKLLHGPTIIDRKSTFQGHVCRVASVEDVKIALRMLLENKKIAQATHNIYCYVIRQENGTFLQDCEDDGETHAGGRLLHLLNILKVENILVVVSRWFGGIHLGPDRFRHINNAARQALVSSGFHVD